MRYFVIAVLAVCIIGGGGVVFAEGLGDLMSKIPAIKEGIAYDLRYNETLTTTTFEIITREKDEEANFWMSCVNSLGLDVGIGTDFDDLTFPIGAVSYELGNLERFGFEYPLKEYVNLEVFAFAGREINRETDNWHYGGGLNILKGKF